MGCLRIGTLYDYRRAEHRRGIADPTEGKKWVSHHISSLHVADSDDPSLQQSMDYRALGAFRAIHLGGAKNIRIQNISLSQEFDVPDCFLYCLSKERSERLYQEFEGADSCVEIFDPHTFFDRVSESLNDITRVRFQGVHEVTYSTRTQEWNGVDWGTHPALLKEPKFQRQAELRAVWTPIYRGTIEPVVIGNLDIPAYCRMVERG